MITSILGTKVACLDKRESSRIMEFRKSEKSDINNIMNIIKQAQDYFKEQGINQWQNNYPSNETIHNDINQNISYVLLKDNDVVATAAVSFDGEKTYDTIYDGEWVSNGAYAVIHRIAVNNNYKGMGLSSKIINEVEELCIKNNVNSIKIDTHEANISMQSLLRKNNFKYCGKITLEDGAKRIAFEKVLS